MILIHNILNDRCVEWEMLTIGYCILSVPQGSILGSLFFLVYMNDIVDNVRCDIKLFADDSSIFSVVRNDCMTMKRDLRVLKSILIKISKLNEKVKRHS